jgi:hypothetical protein
VKKDIAVAAMEAEYTKRRGTMQYSKFGSRAPATCRLHDAPPLWQSLEQAVFQQLALKIQRILGRFRVSV